MTFNKPQKQVSTPLRAAWTERDEAETETNLHKMMLISLEVNARLSYCNVQS